MSESLKKIIIKMKGLVQRMSMSTSMRKKSTKLWTLEP